MTKTSPAAFPATLTAKWTNGSQIFDMFWAADGEILPTSDGESFDKTMGKRIYKARGLGELEGVSIHVTADPSVKSDVSANSDPETGLYVDASAIAAYAALSPSPEAPKAKARAPGKR